MSKLLLTSGLALLLLGLEACDHGASITWVNESDKSVSVYLGNSIDDFDVTVPPQSSRDVATIKRVWKDIVVLRDDEGNILSRQELTWDDLKARNFRFIITADMVMQAS